MGSVLGSGSQRANECRIAMFYAGFPEEVPVRVVNRQCPSGLQANADVVASIRCAPRLPSPPLHTSRSRADLVSPSTPILLSNARKGLDSTTLALPAALRRWSSGTQMAWDGSINPRISDFEKAQGCLLPMGTHPRTSRRSTGSPGWSRTSLLWSPTPGKQRGRERERERTQGLVGARS